MTEYKYITQEIIDEGAFNVTSADMYADADRYNSKMLEMQRKKVHFNIDFYGGFILDIIVILPLLLNTYTDMKLSLVALFTDEQRTFSIISVLLILLYEFMHFFFVAYKKEYSYKLYLPYSLPLMAVNVKFIILVISECIILYLIRKYDKEMKDEAGYPHFALLNISYFYEDEEVKEITYDTFKSNIVSEEMEEL